MNAESFFELLADLDDAYILEARETELAVASVTAATSVTHGTSDARDSSSRKALPRIILPVALGIAALLLVLFGVGKITGLFGKKESVTEEETTAAGNFIYETTEATAPGNPEGIPESWATSPAGGDYGEETRYTDRPYIPSNSEIVLTGTPITEEDGNEYIAQHMDLFTSMLSSFGVSTDNLRFSSGYHHVRYEGVEGESLTIDLSFVDYLIYSNDELVAFLTLYRDINSGEILQTLGYGGPWFPEFDRFLQSHKGEDILFLYAGSLEIVLAPDGTIKNPQGLEEDEVAKYFEGLDDPYTYFYHDLATYHVP